LLFLFNGPPFEGVPMTSLYDLLGARESDDVDALKKAFRKAVKAHHPDLHPGDPDAPERFRQLIAANALLRDAKQRATYDRVLQLERRQFQLRLECHQLRSKLDRQHVRLRRMRTTAAVAAVGALVGGYALLSPLSTTAIVAISKDERAAAPIAAVKKRMQTAAVIAAVQRDENTPTAITAPKADAVKSDVEKAGGSVETTGAQLLETGAQLMETAAPPDRSAPRDQHDDVEVAAGASKPNANPSATKNGDAPVVAGREQAPGPVTKDASFYKERGIAAYRSGDFLGAIGNFDEAIRLNPNDAQSHNIRGNVWDELSVFERALADYDAAIRIDSNNPAVFHDRAILWQRKGALDKALVDLDRAIRFSFTDAHLYCDRGLVWYQRGRHERAIADFDQAIKLDPNFTAAYINRGLILHSNREFTVAFADSKAIRVDPSIFDVTKRTKLRP
jgi:tetratricopeptide (TPR) repeat protein